MATNQLHSFEQSFRAMEADIPYESLLSEAECREIVGKAVANVSLVSYEIVPATSETVGYLGDYYKLNAVVRQDDEQTRSISFFIKSLPLHNQVHRAVIKRLKFMDKETELYNLFQKMREYASEKWHPEMYLCRDDVLVLEDLIQCNYKHEQFGLNIPTSCIWSALKCMAAMHANSIVYEVKTGANIGSDYLHLFNRTITKGNTWVNSGLKSIYTLARIHPQFQSLDYQNFIASDLKLAIEKVHELGKISQEYRNTLCHRDIWEKNVMLKQTADGWHCILVDFQITRYIPPGIDVTLFLHMNANRSNREANMTTYLDYYYECLAKFTADKDVDIVNELSRSEFDKTCEEFKLIPLVLTCVYAPIIYLPDFNILRKINQSDPVQFQHIMNNDRSDFAVECINKFEEYGKRVMEVVEELVEYLYRNKSKL